MIKSIKLNKRIVVKRIGSSAYRLAPDGDKIYPFFSM